MASPLYKKTLIIGATSGIGECLAKKLILKGTRVIITGRRQGHLQNFVSEMGADKVSAALDVLNLASIPSVAQQIIAENPDLDSVIINAGIQRPFDFTKPGTVDFDIFQQELTTKYIAAGAVSMAFLPHLQNQPKSSLVYISATLGLVPTMLRTANYNASKAALHHWILAFRRALRDTGSEHVKVVEVFPPAVQTELHDTRHQPDLKDGHMIGMPLEQFTEECFQGLVGGTYQIGVGHGKVANEGWEMERQRTFNEVVGPVNDLLAAFKAN